MSHTYTLVVCPNYQTHFLDSVRKTVTSLYLPQQNEIIILEIQWEFQQGKSYANRTEIAKATIERIEHRLGKEAPSVFATMNERHFKEMITNDDTWEKYISDAEIMPPEKN